MYQASCKSLHKMAVLVHKGYPLKLQKMWDGKDISYILKAHHSEILVPGLTLAAKMAKLHGSLS